MQSLALDVQVISEDGGEVEVREEDDELLRAAEELGIDLSPGSLRAAAGAAERRGARGGRRGGDDARPRRARRSPPTGDSTTSTTLELGGVSTTRTRPSAHSTSVDLEIDE